MTESVVFSPWTLGLGDRVSASSALKLAVTILGAYVLTRAIYNVYFHPLSKIPGPFWGRASLLWRFWHTMSGRSHRAIQEQHQKYGPVFRVSPNELSFASVESWKAIYGAPPPGQQHIIKSEFYDTFGAGFKTGCIGSERDPRQHALKKKSLAAAFSTQALNAQEALVQQCWDRFIDKLGDLTKRNPQGFDIVKWFEMATFDILGEMAFGESFGCIQEEKSHFWLKLILEHLVEVMLVDNLRRFHLLATIGGWFLPSLTTRIRREHTEHSRTKVQRRLDADNTRQDFFTNLVSKVKAGDVSQEEMTAHASTLIIAGGETTAHTLSALFYYLLKTPTCKGKLFEEIRARYKSYDEIDATSALQLPYLKAVMNEALRIHPSGAQGFPRISPGLVIDGIYVPAGTEVYTSAWAVTHDEANFHDPYTFKPERWLDPECRDIKDASQPFSLGYRGCLGRNFAFMEMALCLTKMAFRYDWELVNKDLDWEDESRCYIMWWKAPILARFIERDLS
ncbi:cytochrome protein [Astrocystis sublimbata]|nr:cytochrome protein [Astrocystis sublimbata]